jgi:hypothetical protein
VSGDNLAKEYDEPSAMRTYLINAGMPAEAIVADNAGFDTYESAARASRIFGITQLIVVTQSYHLPRAVATCRALGIDATGVGDDSVRHGRAWRRGLIRDQVACVKTVIDLITRRSPEQGRPEASAAEARADFERAVAAADDGLGPPVEISWTGGQFEAAETPAGHPFVDFVREAAAAELEKKHKEIASLVRSVGGAVERADTRSWHLLPGVVGVARVRLPVGEHAVAAMVEGAPVSLGTVRVTSGGLALATARVWRRGVMAPSAVSSAEQSVP